MIRYDTQFEWPIALQGYQWLTGRRSKTPGSNPERFLTELPRPGKKGQRELFQQFPRLSYRERVDLEKFQRLLRINETQDDPPLFKQFAKLDFTEASILAFAHKYGMLWKKEDRVMMKYPEREKLFWYGEPYEDWEQEIQDMKAAVQLWELLQVPGRNKDLAQLIKWEEAPRVPLSSILPANLILPVKRQEKVLRKEIVLMYKGPYRDAILFEPEEGQKEREAFRPSDRIFWARNYLAQIVNKHLSEGVTQQFWWDDANESLSLYLQPLTLAGALWLQLGRAIEEEWSPRRCERCGKIFITTTPRENKRHCSPTCQKKAWEKNKAKKKPEARKNTRKAA